MKSIQLNDDYLLDSESVAFERNQLNDVLNGMIGKILWQNSNPNTEFISQNITLNSSDYDILEFYFLGNSSNPIGEKNARTFIAKALKGTSVVVTWTIEINEGLAQYTGFRNRSVDYISDTTYSVSKGLQRIGGTDTMPQITNNYLIPLYVIGYKTGLF